MYIAALWKGFGMKKFIARVLIGIPVNILGMAVCAICAAGAGIAYAATVAHAAGPGVSPESYYTGPVHICVSQSNEGVVYVEEHTTAVGNCAAGYDQAEINVPYLDPAGWSVTEGGATLTCTPSFGAADPNEITAVTCK